VNEQLPAELSIYDRLRRSDAELSGLLASGAARRELTAVFGASEYAVLAALARKAQRIQRHHAEPVYILPGIMGTQLGAPRAAPTPADLLWLDPQDADTELDPLLEAHGQVRYSTLSRECCPPDNTVGGAAAWIAACAGPFPDR